MASNGSSAANIDFKGVDALLTFAESEGRKELSPAEIARLMACAGMDLVPKSSAAGAEMFVGVRNMREFGMILSAGLGGTDRDVGIDAFRAGQAMVTASVVLTDADNFFKLFQRSFAYRKLTSTATRACAISDEQLRALFGAMIALGNAYGPGGRNANNVLEELVLHFGRNPLVGSGSACRFGKAAPMPAPRPIAKIGKLLHPQSIGLIGASASKMNFGRIILKNLLASGYDKDKMVVIRPGETQIDGVQCVKSLSALDRKLDLFVVAVAADAVFELVDEIIALDAAESVMLIPGGLGETQQNKDAAARMGSRIHAAHLREGGGPIFLGGNCLGVVSHPGRYDSWFIPQERLARSRKKERQNSALISQSGAFMVMRLSHNPWLDPAYMVAVGNQSDLTHGDLLSYFADDDEIDAIGVYVEGFRDLDGLVFARAVRQAVIKGKQVVVYKAGRTSEGSVAALGHTASIAGDHAVCEAVLQQAGALVVRGITEFDDLFYIATALHEKKIGGNRLGAISGAGFETVGIADSIHGEDFSMEMAPLGDATVARLAEILIAKKLDALMEVRNPFDINPGADDEAHAQCTQAMLEDPSIDAVVVGLDPVSPAMRTLEESARAGFDIHSAESIVQQLPKLAAATHKPVVGIVDGGTRYDPMANKLMDAGVCVFRSCERGVAALVKYAGSRLYAQELRRKFGGSVTPGATIWASDRRTE